MDKITHQRLKHAVEEGFEIVARYGSGMAGNRILATKQGSSTWVIQRFDRSSDLRNAWPGFVIEMGKLRGRKAQ